MTDSRLSLSDKVKFAGVLANDNRLLPATVPFQYQNHRLIRGQHFYTVPQQLLKAVSPAGADALFEADSELIEMENMLSGIANDHSSIVGFWNNQPINCGLLMSMPISREMVPGLDGLSDAEINKKLAAMNERLLGFQEITCAYAGWLMQNQDFVTELTEFSSRYSHEISEWGFAKVGLLVPRMHPLAGAVPNDQLGWREYESAVLDFCIRWRLQGLAGPRIPVPMRPMMSGNFPISIVKQLMRAGGVFNWPDTFPLYARDQMRDIIHDALTANCDSHLQEWKSIIASNNKSKNQFSTFERLFRFQHFWRLLRERHPNAFPRRVNIIQDSFAEYLGVSTETVRKDRKLIRKQLGDNWDSPGNQN